MYLVINKS